MDNSIRYQDAVNGASIVLENHGKEQSSEAAAEWVLSTSETVRVNVFPPHLREASHDIWLHSSTKDITDPISNTIVSRDGTMASLVDGQISSFVDIDLKQADVDDLLTDHNKSMELFEERSLASERPSSPSSSKSFEVLKWTVNQEQSSNEHQLKQSNSLGTEIDGHSIRRIINKENLKQSFESQISHSQCRFNGDEVEVASTVIGELRHIRQQVSSQARKIDEFLEKAESDKQQRLEFTRAEQQATEIRLKNTLTELETTRAEMVKVQRESVRNTATDWTAITSLRNELNRVENELALESYKHAEQISSLEEKNAATAHALEQIQKEASLLKSSLENSSLKNESALVQLAKAEGRLEEALDRENSLKLELKELQNQLSSAVKQIDESYKHAEQISSLEEKNAATAHALEQIQKEASLLKSSLENSSMKNESALVQLAKAEGRLEEALDWENSLKLELKELQNQLSSVVKQIDESYKHAEEISSLEEKNAATVHALGQTQTEASRLKSSLESAEGQLVEALGRENVLKIESKKLQNELRAMKDEKDKNKSRPEATFRCVIPNFKKGENLKILSVATIVRDLSWRIKAYIKRNPKKVSESLDKQEDLAVFLYCDEDSDSASWSCQAAVELRLVSQKEGVESFTRKYQHLFTAKEENRGWLSFMSCSDVCDPEKGYIKDDCIILEVHLVAEAPQFGVSLDSKENTGYAGLKN